MARRKLSIDDKIEQQKLAVSKAKDRYEAELEELNQLMKKRDELRNKELLQAIEILPERLYPYYLLAKLYAEPEFYQEDKFRAAASAVLTKEPKVESTAVREMRTEIKKILEKK